MVVIFLILLEGSECELDKTKLSWTELNVTKTWLKLSLIFLLDMVSTKIMSFKVMKLVCLMKKMQERI